MSKFDEHRALACLCEVMEMTIRQANQIEALKMANTATDEKLIAMDALVDKVFAEIAQELAFLKQEMQTKGVTEAGMLAISNIETKLAAADAERPDLTPDPVPEEPEPTEPILDENGNPIVTDPAPVVDENGNPVA